MVRIEVLGNIGAGKTELASLVAHHLSTFTAVYEQDVRDNPYLEDFLRSSAAYALHNQLYFLYTALEAYNSRPTSPDTIQDYSILGCPIFAEAMMRQGFFDGRDYSTYERLCSAIFRTMTAPSLYVLVRASVATLQHRIQQRSRGSETTLSYGYLSTIQELHDTKLLEHWIPQLSAPLITIDTDRYDLTFPHNVPYVLATINRASREL